MYKKIIPILVVIALSGCMRIQDETFYMLGDIVSMKVEDNRLKARVSTGIDECRFKGRGNVLENEYEVKVLCELPIDLK